MATTVAILGAVAGLMSTHSYREKYTTDGSGWWQLVTALAVTTGLMFVSILVNS